MNNLYEIKGGRSCSSMVATGKVTDTGNILYAKNSDRPFNEAQPLIFYPARDYPDDSTVECSFVRIPQVKHTYACVGSRPHVFFGFEHGINEFGLSIGNEQVSGREIPEKKWGLIGMDILRLTLERAKTAKEAIDVIDGLMKTYGTGGDPGIRIPQFNSNYIIADSNEVYLFESHQTKWVAKKVDTVGYIGNCYSIQNDYDLIAEGTVEEAEVKGWHYPGNTFNAAHSWTIDRLLYDESEGFVRYARVKQLMESKDVITKKYLMNNCRDHYEGVDIMQTIFSPAANKTCSICTHPGGDGDGCCTAATTVTEIRKDVPHELRFTFWGSMAPPCCSVFRPYYNIGELPDDLQHAHAIYRAEDQWWRFIELERYIALDYQRFAPKVREKFDAMENEFLDEAKHIEKNYVGNKMQLKEFSERCTKLSYDMAVTFIDEIKSKLKTKDLDRMLINYFRSSSDTCGMPYDGDIIK